MTRRAALAFAAALALGGCGGLWGGDGAALPPCPDVRVLAEGESWADDALEAEISGFEARCDWDDDEDPAAGMTLALAVIIDAARAGAGPAAAELPWFAAVVGPGRAVASKRVFAAEFAFESPDAPAGAAAREEIDLRFPAGAARPPWEYEVLVGFQLDRAQLDRRRGERR